jgi:DNA-binding transcriptional LysR family regulator
MAKLDSRRMDEIAALLAVAATHSFAAAGKALERHPTIISKRIAALESRLGVRLVARTTRQVQLTDAGKRLADKLRVATDLIYEAQQEATETAEELRGSLKLALPATMGRLWLAARLPEFMALYPKLELDVHYSDAYVDLVEGGFDAAIRVGYRADSGLVARKLADHQRVLAASPGYIEQHGMPLEPSDLPTHNCIGNPRLSSYPIWRLSDGEQVEAVRTNGTLHTNDSMAMLEAARAGIGILGAGEWLLARDLAAGKLVRILPDWTFDGDGGIYLVRPSRRYAPARSDAFAAWITDLFQPIPWA